MYGCQQSQGRETGGCVEVSPIILRSAELRAIYISKVKGEKGRCVETGGCVEVSPNVRKPAESRATEVSKVRGERKVACLISFGQGVEIDA